MKKWLILLPVFLPTALLPGVQGNAQNDDYWVLTEKAGRAVLDDNAVL